mmetsp:Transcript_27331/g.62731  ORF Transcript_27331/g.62731 Transcript_27331/m.62731 type:complete len:498 (-) Transcript_27331:158-1651(-)
MGFNLRSRFSAPAMTLQRLLAVPLPSLFILLLLNAHRSNAFSLSSAYTNAAAAALVRSRHPSAPTTSIDRFCFPHIAPPLLPSLFRRRKYLTKLASTKSYTDESFSHHTESPLPSFRSVRSITRHPRLPVWPVWNGVAIFFLSKIFGEAIGDAIEDALGGRVCPISFLEGVPGGGYYNTDPFLLVVHHNHSFGIGDPLRFFQRKFILPEGFPAHPHRGFSTLTYCMKGGMVHRDSSGLKQRYGENGEGGAVAQWMVAGGGMLHEEMWDVTNDWFDRQELYQIWINLPSFKKLGKTSASLLGGEGGAHVPKETTVGTETDVLVGDHGGKSSGFDPPTDVCVLHVRMRAGSTWTHKMASGHETAMLYVRRGSVSVDGVEVPSHSVAHLSTKGETVMVKSTESGGRNILKEAFGGSEVTEFLADFLLLTGSPLEEPVAASGTMVMNNNEEVNAAGNDYQKGLMGMPWEHTISDEDWMEHVKKYPNQYATNNISNLIESKD